MTKERKVAIEMWESLVGQLPVISSFSYSCCAYKEAFMESYPYEWQNSCWLCEYCRKDYRFGHVGREDFASTENHCEACPLYKYEIARGNIPIVKDACGCANSDWDSETLWGKVYINKDVEAAKIILSILKGEKIENLL